MKNNNMLLSYLYIYYLYGINKLDKEYLKIINNLSVDDIKEAANMFFNDEFHAEFVLMPE
ncbi:MAG: hypothetical protein Kow0068_19590 [Marinilabiliales bacterium]